MAGILAIALITSSPLRAQTVPSAPPFAGGPAATSAPITTPPAPAAPTNTTPPFATSGTTAKTTATVQTPTDLTYFQLMKPLDITSPADVQAKLTDLLKNPELKDLPVSRVRVEGQANGRPTSSGAAVNISWTTLTLDDHSKSLQLPTSMLTKLLSGAPIIPQATDIKAKGDVPVLVTAIKELLKGVSADQNTSADTIKNPDPAKQSKTSNSSSGSGNNPTAGGGGASNDVAGTYKPMTLASNGSAATTTPTTSVTTQACPTPRIDWNNGQVFLQSQTVTTTNGTAQTSACSDSGTALPIQYDTQTCQNVTDTANMVVNIMRKPYYANPDNGQTVYLGACTKDPDKSYTMRFEYQNCPVDTKTQAGYAVPQSELVYYDGNNSRVVVSACGIKAGEVTYPIQSTANGCTLRNDFTALKSYVQEQQYYVAGGVQVSIQGGCKDTSTTYPMVTDTSVCKPLVDTAAQTYTTMAEMRIDTPNGAQYITQCQPTGNTQSLTETFTGCETQHDDDFTAGTSYLYTRWLLKGTTTVAQDCARSKNTAAHQYVVNGWSNDDTLKQSTQKLEVWIDLTAPVGHTLIQAAQVRPQSLTLPYVLQSVSDVPNGQSTYTGCNAYRLTTTSQVYKRPDGSAFNYAIGSGTPVGPVNVCVSTITNSQYMETGTWSTVQCQCDGSGSLGPNIRYWGHYMQTVNKTVVKNIETGLIISTTCGFPSGTSWNSNSFTDGSGTTSAWESTSSQSLDPSTSCPF